MCLRCLLFEIQGELSDDLLPHTVQVQSTKAQQLDPGTESSLSDGMNHLIWQRDGKKVANVRVSLPGGRRRQGTRHQIGVPFPTKPGTVPLYDTAPSRGPRVTRARPPTKHLSTPSWSSVLQNETSWHT